jgi:GT2 family glycosyltransferase
MPKMITRPDITIVMPFFNSAATLELSIRSLLNQSYDKFELLLCDDGSHDRGLPSRTAATTRVLFVGAMDGDWDLGFD